MHACRFEARAVCLDHQPVHEREDFVEARIAVQVGVVVEAVAAVAVADVGRNQRQAGLAGLRYAVTVGIDVRAGVQIGTPLRHREFLVDVGAIHFDLRHQTIEHDVVPLIEYRELEIALRDIGEGEVTVRVTLGEGEIGLVRCAQPDIALREAVGVVAAAAVDALVGCAAHARIGDLAGEGGGAGQSAPGNIYSGHRIFAFIGVADAGPFGVGLAIIDDLRVGEADHDVESAGAEFLEVGGFSRLDERFVSLAAVQRICLQPFFAASDAVGRGRCDDFIQTGIQVGNDCLTCQRRQRLAVRLIGRAGRHHAHQPVSTCRDRARIQTGDRVDLPGQ